MANITITEIEAMGEQELRTRFAPDFEAIPLKGFTLYLVDVAGVFGYSKIVFGEGRQIIWANDYQLHHSTMTREELREWYIKTAEHALFTEEELAQPLKNYMDYQRRRKFISELLPLTRDYISAFHYEGTAEERAARAAAVDAHPVFCPYAFGYFTAADAEFATHISELFLQLVKQEQDTANNYEYSKNAFYYELGNHEYHINTYQGDYDTLSAFGNITWRGQSEEALQAYFAELGFTETQKRAYRDARKEFLHNAAKNGWY